MTKFTGQFEDVEVREPDEHGVLVPVQHRTPTRRSIFAPSEPTFLTKLAGGMILVGLLVRLTLWAKDYFAG